MTTDSLFDVYNSKTYKFKIEELEHQKYQDNKTTEQVIKEFNQNFIGTPNEAKIARKKAISDNQEQIRNKKNNITEQIDAIKKAMYKEYLKNNVYVFMNDSVFSTILDKAYDESHSEGMDEVYCTFDELVDFVGDIMYSVKNNIIQY